MADDAGDRLQPSLLAVDSRISTSVAAPSALPDEDAAVMVPLAAKAGLRVGIFSTLSFCGRSSSSITVSPFLDLMVTGTVSHFSTPSRAAFCARETDSTAKVSCSSRVKPYLAAQSSPNVPMARPTW